MGVAALQAIIKRNRVIAPALFKPHTLAALTVRVGITSTCNVLHSGKRTLVL